LALIYQAKGLPEDQAKTLAQRLIANKETALDTLAREELGIDREELGGSAWTAAGTSFLLFAIGAIFPVAPYFALSGAPAMLASVAASGAALFLIGAGTTLFTCLGVWFSAIPTDSGRVRSSRRHLRHRQADRHRGHGLKRNVWVRARNSARAS